MVPSRLLDRLTVWGFITIGVSISAVLQVMCFMGAIDIFKFTVYTWEEKPTGAIDLCKKHRLRLYAGMVWRLQHIWTWKSPTGGRTMWWENAFVITQSQLKTIIMRWIQLNPISWLLLKGHFLFPARLINLLRRRSTPILLTVWSNAVFL